MTVFNYLLEDTIDSDFYNALPTNRRTDIITGYTTI